MFLQDLSTTLYHEDNSPVLNEEDKKFWKDFF